MSSSCSAGDRFDCCFIGNPPLVLGARRPPGQSSDRTASTSRPHPTCPPPPARICGTPTGRHLRPWYCRAQIGRSLSNDFSASLGTLHWQYSDSGVAIAVFDRNSFVVGFGVIRRQGGLDPPARGGGRADTEVQGPLRPVGKPHWSPPVLGRHLL